MDNILFDEGLTARQRREKEYYEQYSQTFDLRREVDFSPVVSGEKRPWNSYWAIYQLAQEEFQAGKRLLDFGSGPGDNALRFAKIGYDVEGFDISEGNVNIANRLFDKYQMKGQFQVSFAEKLPFNDESFDVIAGIDILHHVDIEKSLIECRRVLKKGGVAIFREPLEVDLVDKVRNTSLVKLVAPKDKSFEHHITEDERKLNSHDLRTIKKVFPNLVTERYFFLARFDRFYRKGSDPAPSILERIDALLFKIFPPLKNLGGVVMLILKKE